jgi:hypothetical protein
VKDDRHTNRAATSLFMILCLIVITMFDDLINYNEVFFFIKQSSSESI